MSRGTRMSLGGLLCVVILAGPALAAGPGDVIEKKRGDQGRARQLTVELLETVLDSHL